MSLCDHFIREFAYDAWANDICVAAVSTPSADDMARSLIGHVLASQTAWHRRLRGRDSAGLDLWPESGPGMLTGFARQTSGDFRDYLRNTDDNGLAQMLRYRNQAGKEFTTRIADVLSHVLFHSAGHRAEALRLLGERAPNVDYITWVRTVAPE